MKKAIVIRGSNWWQKERSKKSICYLDSQGRMNSNDTGRKFEAETQWQGDIQSGGLKRVDLEALEGQEMAKEILEVGNGHQRIGQGQEGVVSKEADLVVNTHILNAGEVGIFPKSNGQRLKGQDE